MLQQSPCRTLPFDFLKLSVGPDKSHHVSYGDRYDILIFRLYSLKYPLKIRRIVSLIQNNLNERIEMYCTLRVIRSSEAFPSLLFAQIKGINPDTCPRQTP